MSLDINHILEGWPFEPGQITTRKIRGKDGREKIQLRLDLGLLQMEMTGRPDGGRPYGFDSLLAYYENELERHKQTRGDDKGFCLDERACELMRAEGVMYYHRYLAEFVLDDFEAVERDTMRNLQLLDFCHAYAKEESDRYLLEQYRPYITMMCARARARIALRDNRPKVAMAAVKKALDDVRVFYKRFGQEKLASASGEIALLQALMKEIESRIPVDPIQKLRKQLDRAVKQEHYEEAASIRDQLHRLTGKDFPPPKA